MFIIITIVSLPLFYVYKSSNTVGMEEYISGPKLELAKFTLGNMGGATVLCKSKRIEKGSFFNLNCPNAKNAQI
jgi:hypothetical protein